MKKYIFIIGFFLNAIILLGQEIGIGTTTPNAILDIEASNNSTPTNNTGLLIPRVQALPTTNPSAVQHSMLLYLNATDTNFNLPPGFYFWNNTTSNWDRFGSGERIDDLLDGKSDYSNNGFNGSSIFLGRDAGNADDGTHNQNIGIGIEALKNSSTSENNTVIGFQSLINNNTGNNNTGIGSTILTQNIIGNNNTAIAPEVLRSANASNNVGIGTFSMQNQTSGKKNTAIGINTIRENLTGSNNVALGINAGQQKSTRNNNVLLGAESSKNRNTNNNLSIEPSNAKFRLIWGEFDNDRVGINSGDVLTNTLSVRGDASKTTTGNWLSNSDKRLKKDIKTINTKEAFNKITQLRGVTYYWNDTKTGIIRPTNTQYGFIAQEIMEVFPTKVSIDNLSYYQTAYGNYDALYVQAFKAIDEKINTLENENKLLEQKLIILQNLSNSILKLEKQ